MRSKLVSSACRSRFMGLPRVASRCETEHRAGPSRPGGGRAARLRSVGRRRGRRVAAKRAVPRGSSRVPILRPVSATDHTTDPEPWGEDPKLVEVLGEQGAAEFRALFDGFPDAVGVLWALRDEDGQIVDFTFGYGNPSILRAFRLPAATRDRYTLLEALPPMRGSRAFTEYVRVCETGEPWVHEVTYDTPFGDGYMLGTFVERSAKLGDGLVNFLTDVTDQRRMDAELRSYADVVAHDLSAPVSGIALLVTMLERRSEEPPPPDVLRQLRQSTERARDLINGVLVYAQAGELTLERVALAEVVADVAEDLRPSLDEAGATLDVGALPEVECDRRQLRRVLQNLVANAVKFRGEAPPRVEISARRDTQEWVVTVRDNGRGIDAGQAGRIFGMFSRGDREIEGA